LSSHLKDSFSKPNIFCMIARFKEALSVGL
jgi:hypothetical protein